MRKHTATQARPVDLIEATETVAEKSRREFLRKGDSLVISANGIPDHLVGRFPNPGNPNSIAPQGIEFSVSANPKMTGGISPLRRGPFGFALNGVFLDPGAAEFWLGDPERGWQYEALGGAIPLGLDENHAHVQPTGTYHYHGIPTLLMKRLGASDDTHSPQVGWAADGFPIYCRVGYRDSKNPKSGVVVLKSSWRLKSGNRPAGPDGPGGPHDGAFVQDYEFVAGSGDLDECNGRFSVTPEFPEGTYVYFLTDQWPVIPRAFRGTPVNLRGEGPGGPPQGPGGGPGGRPAGRPPR